MADTLQTARKRFKVAAEAEQKQREREKDDLRFQVPELQWDEGARRQRLGLSMDGVPVPARPVLSISKIAQPIQMVLNQERGSKLGVSIQPLSADSDPETAAILEGIYRRIERDSQAHVARSWAFSRAVKCGRGAYRVNTKYDDTSDNPFDQVITIERILHQESVYFDPAATKPDYCDGNFAFVASWVRLEDFKAEYPNATVVKDGQAFEEMCQEEPEWVRGDGEERAVRVLEYFWKEKTFEDVKFGKDSRKREVVKVKWAKLTAVEVLEEQDWNGRYIPIIPVIGEELHPFDSERRWQGIIGPAKDAQRLYNYAASSAVELAALEPKAPYVGAEGQFEGHESEWAQANMRNFPYLEYKPTTIAGELAPPPQRAQVDVGRLGPSMQLLQQADQFIQVTTATYDPSLGRVSSRERSGRAILALQEQGDQSNSHFMHNLADISMRYEAAVILDLIPVIYDRPERIVRTLDEEDESSTIMLNQPFYRDQQSKMPMPAGPMMPPGQEVKTYDLRKGTYSVAVSIGKTRQSALQEGAEEIGQILQAQPQLMPLIGPLYFRYRDFPGAKEIADLMAQVRDKQFPGLKSGEEEGPTVQQAQAQVQALEQQLQMLGAQMQAAMKAIETEQAKQQTVLMKAQMDNEAKVRVAEIDAQTKLALEGVKGQLEQIQATLKMRHESSESEAARQHETALTAAEALLAPADLNFGGANTVVLEEEKEV